MIIKCVTIFLASLILLLVVELVREEKLTFKYAGGWMLVSAAAIVLAIFDKILFRFSELLGFELPSNFIFFALLSVLVFLSLLMTLFLCQQNRRNDTMAQKIALMEHTLNKMREKDDCKTGDS